MSISTTGSEAITIGSVTTTVDDATRLIRRYVDEGSSSGLFAWPSYDGLVTNGRPELAPADLLAPGLLNAAVGIRSFFQLDQRLDELDAALVALDRTGATDLMGADEETVNAIGGCYAILDNRRPYNVGGTRLSKILHRKRPRLIPLFDRYIRACYAPRLGFDPRRSWQEYMRGLATEMQKDLHAADWDVLVASIDTRGGPGLTAVRALDITAWSLAVGGDPIDQEADPDA